jgi:hypothetical protein
MPEAVNQWTAMTAITVHGGLVMCVGRYLSRNVEVSDGD